MNDLFSDTNRQLRKLSIYKPMQFLITHVDFDVDDSIYDPDVNVLTSEELALNYVGEIWEANDEDDLVEEITNDSAYCINSIDYRIVLK
tara:strand:+ start:168 stop:434 length:267 start_codon:yes stop_codon:yes gene_type:complete